jgi:hypothetical protein
MEPWEVLIQALVEGWVEQDIRDGRYKDELDQNEVTQSNTGNPENDSDSKHSA